MATQTSRVSLDKRPNALTAFFKWWLEPRATNRDEAFRERTIRITVGIMIVLGGLSLSSSIVVFRDEWSLISFPSLHVLGLATSFISALAVARQRITMAGWYLVLSWGIAASGIVILAGRQGSVFGTLMGVPTFVLVIVVAALVLPRQLILLMSLLCTAAFGIIQVALYASGVELTGLDAAQATTSIAILLLAAGAFLRQLRVEFDSRLDAMAESIRQTELAKQQAEASRQRAEEADKAKSQFLANMSHELRTPLNAIIGYDEAMLGGMAGDFTPDQTKLLRNIQQNSRRLLALINDILDLSKIESGSLEVYASPMAPRKVIGEVVESLQSLAQQQRIYLTVSFTEGVPEVVLGDTRKVQQVLINLISNAVKFTSEGGVSVEVDTLDRSRWQIRVRDTGIGMPPDAPTYIFEPFRQVDGTETRKYKGTGLGLAITKRLVDSLGGTIQVETELGKGSTFSVTLPRVRIPEVTEA